MIEIPQLSKSEHRQTTGFSDSFRCRKRKI